MRYLTATLGLLAVGALSQTTTEPPTPSETESSEPTTHTIRVGWVRHLEISLSSSPPGLLIGAVILSRDSNLRRTRRLRSPATQLVGFQALILPPTSVHYHEMRSTDLAMPFLAFKFYPPDHSVIRANYEYGCIPYELVGENKEGFYDGPHIMSGISEDVSALFFPPFMSNLLVVVALQSTNLDTFLLSRAPSSTSRSTTRNRSSSTAAPRDRAWTST